MPEVMGIPSREDMGDLSKLKPGMMATMVVQLHEAERAGRHYDWRIGTPEHGLYSWASRSGPSEIGDEDLKGMFPQPLHTFDYKDFAGNIDDGYGAGRVTKVLEQPILVTEAAPGKLLFSTAGKYPQRYVMIQPDTLKPWMIRLGKVPQTAATFKDKFKDINRNDADGFLSRLPRGSVVQPKIDGALVFIQSDTGRPELVSHRYSLKTGLPVVHTERFFGRLPQKDPEWKGTVAKGELFGEQDGVSIHPAEVSGLLNSSVEKSLRDQKDRKIRLKTMLFDVVSYKGQDVSGLPYLQRLEIAKRLAQTNPSKFVVPPTATSNKDAVALWRQIREGRYPLTKEGVVVRGPNGELSRVKAFDEDDVYIRGVFPATPGSKYDQMGIPGGFYYSLTPDGEVVGKVGTGFDDNLRAMLPDLVGRKARVQHIGSRGGALQKPSLIAIHEGWPGPEDQQVDTTEASELPQPGSQEHAMNQLMDVTAAVMGPGASFALKGLREAFGMDKRGHYFWPRVLQGAGVGAAGGAITSAYQAYRKSKMDQKDPEREKIQPHWARNILLGAGLGGTAGFGRVVLHEAVPQIQMTAQMTKDYINRFGNSAALGYRSDSGNVFMSSTAKRPESELKDLGSLSAFGDLKDNIPKMKPISTTSPGKVMGKGFNADTNPENFKFVGNYSPLQYKLPFYGSKDILAKEIAKAESYAKDKKIPVDFKPLDQAVPLFAGEGGQLPEAAKKHDVLPWDKIRHFYENLHGYYASSARTPEKGDTFKTHILMNSIPPFGPDGMSYAADVQALVPADLYPLADISSEYHRVAPTTDQTMNHELSHIWTGDWLGKWLGPKGNFPLAKGDASFDHGTRPTELVGWLTRIQAELFKRNGKRLETPEEAKSFFKNIISIPQDDEFEKALNVFDWDSRRLFRHLRRLDQKGARGKDKVWDFIGKITPALVQNTSGGAEKIASSVLPYTLVGAAVGGVGGAVVTGIKDYLNRRAVEEDPRTVREEPQWTRNILIGAGIGGLRGLVKGVREDSSNGPTYEPVKVPPLELPRSVDPSLIPAVPNAGNVSHLSVANRPELDFVKLREGFKSGIERNLPFLKSLGGSDPRKNFFGSPKSWEVLVPTNMWTFLGNYSPLQIKSPQYGGDSILGKEIEKAKAYGDKQGLNFDYGALWHKIPVFAKTVASKGYADQAEILGDNPTAFSPGKGLFSDILKPPPYITLNSPQLPMKEKDVAALLQPANSLVPADYPNKASFGTDAWKFDTTADGSLDHELAGHSWTESGIDKAFGIDANFPLIFGNGTTHFTRPTEIAGWLSRIQAELFQNTGKRLETPDEVEKFFRGFDDIKDPAQFEKAIEPFSWDARRFFRSMRRLNEDGSIKDKSKVLEVIKKLAPALVDVLGLGSGSAGKTAAAAPGYAATGAILGGSLGALITAFNAAHDAREADNDPRYVQPKHHWTRNILLGAALGGGKGLLAGMREDARQPDVQPSRALPAPTPPQVSAPSISAPSTPSIPKPDVLSAGNLSPMTVASRALADLVNLKHRFTPGLSANMPTLQPVSDGPDPRVGVGGKVEKWVKEKGLLNGWSFLGNYSPIQIKAPQYGGENVLRQEIEKAKAYAKAHDWNFNYDSIWRKIPVFGKTKPTPYIASGAPGDNETEFSTGGLIGKGGPKSPSLITINEPLLPYTEARAKGLLGGNSEMIPLDYPKNVPLAPDSWKFDNNADNFLEHELAGHSWNATGIRDRLGPYGNLPLIDNGKFDHFSKPSEIGGWLSRIQAELFQNTGKRLETPEEVGSFFEKYVGIKDPAQFEKAIEPFSWDVRRFFRNMWRLEQTGTPDQRNKVWDLVKDLMPALVDNFGLGNLGSAAKTASVGGMDVELAWGVEPVDLIMSKVGSAKELNHIYVTGQPGSGKTTYAEALAKRLKMPWLQLDRETSKLKNDRLETDWMPSDKVFAEHVDKTLTEPHVIEGVQILGFPKSFLKNREVHVMDTPRDLNARRLAIRGWDDSYGVNYKGDTPDIRERAERLMDMIAPELERFKKKVPHTSVKPDWDNPKDDNKVWYHGSPHRFDTLRAGSWVTPYKEDAYSFGVPWSSKDLRGYGEEGEPENARSARGRPPLHLYFKEGREPDDVPLYVYEVNTGDVQVAKTNTGRSYDWNRQVTKDTPVKLIAEYKSWRDHQKELSEQKNAAVVVSGKPNDFDIKKDELRAQRARVNTSPSEAQARAGNYRLGKIRWNGLEISIENPKGSTRRGVDDKGRPWSSVLSCDYGYIRGTEGADGDHVDCYLGKHLDSEIVFVIDQIRQ